MDTTHQLWKSEQDYLDKVTQKKPELVTRTSPVDPDQILERIGIFGLPDQRPQGYIKYLPQDFIVEEIAKDGTLMGIEPEKTQPDSSDDKRTLWVKMIKANSATLDALQNFTAASEIDQQQIGYAGIKDAVAVTSQMISLRGVEWEQVKLIQAPNLYMDPVKYGKGALQVGDLQGNRFTILIRTPENVTIDWLVAEIERVRENGFWNFYGPQRFGNRYLSHKWGWYLLKGDLDGCLKSFLTESGPFDLPLWVEYRKKLAEIYGDWGEMHRIMSQMPYTFRYEMQVLSALRQDPKKTRNAISRIRDQVRMWTYAYASYCANRLFSRAHETGMKLADQTPLLLSDKPEDWRVYQDFLREDGVGNIAQALEPYGYIKLMPRTIDTKMVPKIHTFKHVDQGIIFSFDLGKGAYATTLLMHLFKMYDGMPLPEWLPTEEVDQKAVIGTGSHGPIKELLGEYMQRRD